MIGRVDGSKGDRFTILFIVGTVAIAVVDEILIINVGRRF